MYIFPGRLHECAVCGELSHCELWCPDIRAGGWGGGGVLKAGMDKVKNPYWKIHIHQGGQRERENECVNNMFRYSDLLK